LKIKPLSPSEAFSQADAEIPEAVILAVNFFLKRDYRGHQFSISQEELMRKIRDLKPDLTPRVLLDNHWLDFEKLYELHGWRVSYEKPGYNESGSCYFKFDAVSK
jgi:hypothetical protein